MLTALLPRKKMLPCLLTVRNLAALQPNHMLTIQCVVCGKEQTRERSSHWLYSLLSTPVLGLLATLLGGELPILQGRYSFVASQPALEIMATGQRVTILNHRTQERSVAEVEDPLETVVAISRRWKPVPTEGIPRVFTGGWAGYCGYDTVRYVYGGIVCVFVLYFPLVLLQPDAREETVADAE